MQALRAENNHLKNFWLVYTDKYTPYIYHKKNKASAETLSRM